MTEAASPSSLYRMRPMSHHVEANGLRLHYLDWGEGPSQNLFLLHGLSDSARTWDDFAKEASAGYRVVAVDLRGHGESGHATDGYTLDKFAADVLAVARGLNVRTFHLVGHSLGALVGIHLAATQPRAVTRLALVDGGPGINVAPARQYLLPGFSRPMGFATEDEAKAWLKQTYSAEPEEVALRRFQYDMQKNWAGRWVLRQDPELWWFIGDEEGFRKRTDELWALLPQVQCPTLFLHGRQSRVASEEAAQRIVAALPKGRLVDIPGARHNIHSDQPALFKEALLGFLGE